MSEMTTIQYLETKRRMCKLYEPFCTGCPLIKTASSHCDTGGNLDEAIGIVQKWGEEHPVKTLMDKFLEVFPDAEKNSYGVPRRICPSKLGYKDEVCGQNLENCIKCWSQPYIENKS